MDAKNATVPANPHSAAVMEKKANDINELVAELNDYYQRLTPEQRKEADVQRAYRIITLFANTDHVRPELQNRYRRWLIENGDREHVAEAIYRFFKSNLCECN